MNDSILNTVIQQFINSHLDSNTYKLLLQKPQFDDVSNKEIVEQIEAKNKCKTKLPTWYNSEDIYYPNKLSIEQTSSEITANYKSSLLNGKTLIDITGGFGVDAFYFSKKFELVTHIEQNIELSQIVVHNYKILKAKNIETYALDGLEYLAKSNTNYNWIYVDPSRRHESKGKVVFLKDCLPNVPSKLEQLFTYSNNIMVKTSPLLDIKAGLGELHFVKEIHIVAVNNDVKELLWLLKKGYEGNLTVKTVNFKNNVNQCYQYLFEEESFAQASYSEPLTYLYESNNAIMKSGAFRSISRDYGVNKLNVNTHLYTSDELMDFPGRSFKIERKLPYNKKLLKKEFLFKKANVSTRNFPDSVERLRKLLKLKDGGTIYLFFTTDVNEHKVVLVCSRV